LWVDDGEIELRSLFSFWKGEASYGFRSFFINLIERKRNERKEREREREREERERLSIDGFAS
jgi:hypothetical protein